MRALKRPRFSAAPMRMQQTQLRTGETEDVKQSETRLVTRSV